LTRTEYYNYLKKIAREQRALFNLNTPTVKLTDMRRAYKHHGVTVMLWPPKNMTVSKTKTIRGAYRHIEGEPTVLISRNKPKDQRVFTMAHELKHHLVDFELVKSGGSACVITEDNDYIEKGAEIFAAELIFPEEDFIEILAKNGTGKGQCTPETIVRLKHDTGTTLSHGSLAKRATFLKYADVGVLDNARWFKLDEAIYGEPVYKQIQRYRKIN
jgi:Zn-dependent peptidase ImmA (M78 family)